MTFLARFSPRGVVTHRGHAERRWTLRLDSALLPAALILRKARSGGSGSSSATTSRRTAGALVLSTVRLLRAGVRIAAPWGASAGERAGHVQRRRL